MSSRLAAVHPQILVAIIITQVDNVHYLPIILLNNLTW